MQTLEEKVTSLDEKITDIESENEILKEEKLRTETEKEVLLQQIQVIWTKWLKSANYWKFLSSAA